MIARLALLAALLLAGMAMIPAAGAAGPPLGSKNFTPPQYTPDYFSNESGPFHTVPSAPRYAAPERRAPAATPQYRYATPAAPRYYAAPVAPPRPAVPAGAAAPARSATVAAAAPASRGISATPYRRTSYAAVPRAAASAAYARRNPRHAQRHRAYYRHSARAGRRVSHVHARLRRHLRHRHADGKRTARHAVNAHLHHATRAAAHRDRATHTATRNGSGRL
jgi:hypothetical protein